MKNKNIYLLALLLLVCILSISAISAAENNANKEVISTDNNKETNLETNIQYNDVSNSKENVELKEEENNNNEEVSESKTDKTKADNAELTFKDLNTTINDNPNSTIYLYNNYKYNKESDSELKKGIIISRNLTIYGNGVTLDGNNMARIFNVTDSNLNVNFYNINFKNGYAFNSGGAIYGGNAYNCNFMQNNATKGGAIYYCNAYNCTFTHNNAIEGGAIYYCNAYNCTFTHNNAIEGGAICNGNAYNCNFTENKANYQGGAIHYGNATNSTFTGNNAAYGGAIYFTGAYNCTFTNNNATEYGGATYGGNAYNSTFTKNNATKGGAIYYCNAYNCTFTHNNAIEGGAIYWGNGYNCTFTYNKATLGGAIRQGNAYNCTFTHNNAIEGGAIYDGILDNCIFTQNNATYGGAIYNGSAYNCMFINNVALYGEVIYVGNTTNCIFIGNKKITLIEINNITEPEIGKEIIITYNTNSNATVTIKINGTTITDGKFTPPASGTYNLTIEIEENQYYTAGYNETTFTAERTNTTVVINPIADVHVGDEVLINYTINSNGTVTVKVNGAPINGAKFTPTKEGIYNITIEVAENDYYTAGYNETTFTAERTNTTVVITPIIDAKAGKEITINYNTNSNGTVTIKVNGDVIADGKFTPTKEGIYNITIEIAENDYYTAATNETTFKVKKMASTIIANPVNTNYNLDKYLTITLKDEEGKPITDQILTVKILGISKKYTTDANGQVKINVATLTPNTYNAKITYNGSDIYNASSSSVKVTVKKATPKITAKAANYKLKLTTKKYTVNLKDNKNKALKNTKVSLKVNGKTYSVKTNSKGQAVFKITNLKKKGTYTAVITVPANTYYNKVSKNVKITVKA